MKPNSQYYSKTTIHPRAWVGINLGRSASTPGAYSVWIPSTGRVVLTSDVYFMESNYPCRPRGMRVDEDAVPVPTTVHADTSSESPSAPAAPRRAQPLPREPPRSTDRSGLMFLDRLSEQ